MWCRKAINAGRRSGVNGHYSDLGDRMISYRTIGAIDGNREQ